MDLEKRVKALEDRVAKLEKIPNQPIGSSGKDKLRDIEDKLGGKIEIIGQQNLIVIALKLKPKQTKKELENLLRGWGVKETIRGWLKSGVFKERLLDKGIVMRDGKNSEEDDLFSLTRVTGEQFANTIMKKYDLS